MKTDREQQRENRLWNTRQLIRTCGGVNAAARILKRDNSYVTAIAGPNPTRSIGDKTANTIEAAFKLEPGALDKPAPKETKRGDPIIAQIVPTLSNADAADREFVLAMSEWIVKRRLQAAPNNDPDTPINANDV